MVKSNNLKMLGIESHGEKTFHPPDSCPFKSSCIIEGKCLDVEEISQNPEYARVSRCMDPAAIAARESVLGPSPADSE